MGHTPDRRRGRNRRARGDRRPIDVATALIAVAVVILLVVAGDGRAPASDAAPPPPGGSSHGATGSGRNGFGGSIAGSATMRSWPGTAADGNGGPFGFIGAHYGSRWKIPAGHNNSLGVGYCVMENVAGYGAVSLQPDPAAWDGSEMALAAALMSSFGGDRVAPYGIDASGPYDVASGEWQQPSLFGGGEYTRRRQVAVNFGIKMFLDDVSPTGAVAGLKLARDTAVVNGSGGEFAALRTGYTMAQRLATVAEIQHAVGGVRLELVWATPDGAAPTQPGTYPLEVRADDATGKPVGYVPIVVLSDIGIDGARTVAATAVVDRTGDTPDDDARWNAAATLGWPTMEMARSMASDPRFGLGANPSGADVTDSSGVARFTVTIADDTWELAFHTQAPTADVALYSGPGVQGQVTWTGRPQSASVHVAVTPPPPPPPVVGTFVVRKALDAADVQGGRDMSGFEFEVTAEDGTALARSVTVADGRTPPIEAVAGTYTITEIAGPPWAESLGDGGPVTFAFEPPGVSTADSDPVDITYTNTVPGASIATAARDAGDGDQVVHLDRGDATIIDSVTYAGLVPGTAYVVTGELMIRPTDDPDRDEAAADTVDAAKDTIPAETATDPNGDVVTVASATIALTEMIPSGITGSTTFVPVEPDGSVDVELIVPAESPLLGHTVVVYQQLAVASSARVIAIHADPAAPAQTIRVAAPVPTTTAPTTIATTIATTVPATTSTTNVGAAQPPPSTAPPTTTAPTTTAPTTSAPTRPPTTLPRTGTDSSRSLALVALTLLLLGIALATTARRPARGRPDGAPGPR